MALLNEYIMFAENELFTCIDPGVIEELFKYAERCDKFINTPMAGFWFDRFAELINKSTCTCETCGDLKDFTSTLQKQDYLVA